MERIDIFKINRGRLRPSYSQFYFGWSSGVVTLEGLPWSESAVSLLHTFLDHSLHTLSEESRHGISGH
jgi:hypothetical protein